MAAFTVTTTQNLDQITGKTGGDTYAINGGNLTIDGHSRFDLNGANTSATAATTLGSITLSATLGGTCTIDGRAVRLIAYTAGSGTLPAMGSTVTMGGASGKIMCVTANHTSLPVTSGTIPASGFIHIKQWNGVEYGSGALTLSGITATSSGASVVGYLEIMGDEASTVNANRLGTFNVLGEWFSLGVTSGVANQTVQIPNNGTLKHIAGVYIEKTAGLKDYEFYPNAGTAVTIGTEAARGKVCWISNTGLVRLGHNGTANMGYTPAANLGIVVPNVMLCNCTTTARNAVAIPHATVATRYDFTTTGGGVVNIDKANLEWYPSFSQAYSVQMTNSGIIDALLLSEIATPMTWSKVGVGNKPTTALLTSPLTMQYCYAGGTFTDCVWTRVSQAASGAHIVVFTDIDGFDFIRNTIRANTISGNATTYSITATRAKNITMTDCVHIQGSLALATCDNFNTTNLTYIDVVSGATRTTYSMYIWLLSLNTINCTFSGLTFGGLTNVHPYGGLLNGASGSSGIKLRNIGTRVAPLSFGSANACGLIYTLATNCSNFKFQRLYVSNTRTGIMTGDNSSHEIVEENVWGDYADAVDVMAMLNHERKGMGGTGALTAQTSVYGTHWRDGFTSTTAGRIAILMNEPTARTTSQVTLANGANFTSAGGLYMPVIGHSVTFEMPAYRIGHTQFANSALVMAGGTATNYNYNFSIDKNDGAGWSTMTTANYTATSLGTALNAIGTLNAQLGFKLRLKITTITTNTTAITSVYMTTVSTTTAQDYQYPLDVITLTLTGLVAGSDIVILNAGTEVERVNVDTNPTASYNYVYETTGNVDIKVYKRGYIPFSIMNYTLSSTNASLPVAQVADRNYIE
jgi:hypothetical protein